MGSLVPSSDTRARPRVTVNTLAEVERVVHWYVETAYGRWEGPGTTPFFADPSRVGGFAVELDKLAARQPEALFRLLVTVASYQSRRDVDIMRIQRSTPAGAVIAMTAPRRLRVLTDSGACRHLRDAGAFDAGCDVYRDFARGLATCRTHPRTRCHVKQATTAIGRMGDLGKMPTSAWLHLGANGFERWLSETIASEADPHARAAALVARTASIFRVGTKLATMYVSALSVPELSGIAPWFPEIDGARLVVVDANVARAIRIWRHGRARESYEQNSRWLLAAASQLDLSRVRPTFRPYVPRFVQQAIYVFRSHSNRKAQGDVCATTPCSSCPSRICPFQHKRLSNSA